MLEFAKHTADVEARLGLRRFFVLGLALSMLTNVLLAMSLVAKDRNLRTVFVPPVITQSFWIDDNAVSAEYLEQMGYFALQLALNNTPANAEYNVRQLLTLVAPGSYGEIEKSLLANVSRLKENNASTVFAVTSSPIANQATRAVVFQGLLSTWIGDKRTSQTAKTFVVRFGYSGGKTYIRELKETTPKDAFKEEDHASTKNLQ